MSLNIEELKKKIIYRSSYRGNKEMDFLMKSFVKSIIDDLDIEGLLKLNELVNLNDEDLRKIKYNLSNQNNISKNNIILKFRNFEC